MQTMVIKKRRAKSEEEREGSKRQGDGCCVLYFLLLVLCALPVFPGGCGPKAYLRPHADVGQIRRIAVLPLENFTADGYASEKVRRIVISELLSCNRDVTEPGEVTRLLREAKMKSPVNIRTSDLQKLGKALGVDAVITGSVEAFGIGRGVSVTYPEVTIDLRLVETSSGNIVWSMRHTSGGAGFWTRHLGSEGMSLSEAAGKAVKECIGTLF